MSQRVVVRQNHLSHVLIVSDSIQEQLLCTGILYMGTKQPFIRYWKALMPHAVSREKFALTREGRSIQKCLKVAYRFYSVK